MLANFRAAITTGLDIAEQTVSHCIDVTVRPARGDNEVITNRRLSSNVDGNDIFSLGFFQATAHQVQNIADRQSRSL